MNFAIAILWIVAAGFLFAAKNPAWIAFVVVAIMYFVLGVSK